jgi:crotonobetainyl-CoA:carnitine CoA-transferase CaiB-like acyl-CoA transferase
VALLDGLRVVEVALLAPNALGMHLADLGADVIKVEEPGRGDYTRVVGGGGAAGVSPLHLRWNRGKRSIAVDLRHPDGAAVFRDLARRSEVVVEGLRAGALARRGLGYDTLHALNPAIVLCSLSGFGQNGPYRDLASHGVAYDAYAGLAPPEITPDGFPAIPRTYQDAGTKAGALYGAMAVLAAVLHARDTGEGAHLDVAQADAAAVWDAGRIDAVLSGLESRGRGMHDAVRYQYYATADGRHVLFQASERHFFERFCRAVGRDDLLAGDGGAEFGEHATGDMSLRRELAAIFVTRTQAEWVRCFVEIDVPGGPVHSVPELLDDLHFQTRANVVEHDHPEAGHLRMLGPPVHTEEPGVAVAPAPTLGEHTDEVLRDVLDCDDARVAALRASGAVA